MVGASSRPATSPRSIEPDKVTLAIVELRHRWLTQARIAAALSISKSTVSRVQGFHAWPTCSPPKRWCDKSMKLPVTCCTSTPRSSGASCTAVTGSRATDATTWTVRVGRFSLWPLKTTLASLSQSTRRREDSQRRAVPAQCARRLRFDESSDPTPQTTPQHDF